MMRHNVMTVRSYIRLFQLVYRAYFHEYTIFQRTILWLEILIQSTDDQMFDGFRIQGFVLFLIDHAWFYRSLELGIRFQLDLAFCAGLRLILKKKISDSLKYKLHQCLWLTARKVQLPDPWWNRIWPWPRRCGGAGCRSIQALSYGPLKVKKAMILMSTFGKTRLKIEKNA